MIDVLDYWQCVVYNKNINVIKSIINYSGNYYNVKLCVAYNYI